MSRLIMVFVLVVISVVGCSEVQSKPQASISELPSSAVPAGTTEQQLPANDSAPASADDADDATTQGVDSGNSTAATSLPESTPSTIAEPPTVTATAETAPSPESTTNVDIDAASKPEVPKAKRPPIYNEQADAKALIAAAVERAKMEHKHVLIEWGGNWCGWCYRLHDVFHNDDTVMPIVFEEFELVLIDSRSNQELLEIYGGKGRQFSYPHLTILDSSGQVLTNQETGSLEDGPKHDPVKVAGFLKQWLPKQLDAEEHLAAALQRATTEDKCVLVQVGTPYCGWCKVLSAFLKQHQHAFDHDYVHLKIDTRRMIHGDDVAATLNPGKDLGVPWMVILDAQGKTLASSVNSQGNNIGYPYKLDEIDHFLTMLKTTKKRLTDSDLESIRTALNVAREEREQKNQPQARAD